VSTSSGIHSAWSARAARPRQLRRDQGGHEPPRNRRRLRGDRRARLRPPPLLPADERRPRAVGRLRRRLQLPQRHGPAPRRAAGHVRAARRPLLRDPPAARGSALHPPLGRGDRHLLALLGHVREGARRPRRLRRRLHRTRRGRQPLRRPGRARPRRRPRHRAHPSEDGHLEARALPARAAPLGRHHAHAARAREGRPPRGSPRAAAETGRTTGACTSVKCRAAT
jgi:hypothetical protein